VPTTHDSQHRSCTVRTPLAKSGCLRVQRERGPSLANTFVVDGQKVTRPSPTGTPRRAYTHSLCSYPLAERDSLLRQRRCGAALAKRLASHTGNHRCGLLKVRFPPNNDRTADAVLCQLCANSGLMQCSKQHLYSITSSAVASSVCGITRLSAVALLRLMTKSNLVGCKTGSSEGFIPAKILPV
jgi:hypothetical protein